MRQQQTVEITAVGRGAVDDREDGLHVRVAVV